MFFFVGLYHHFFQLLLIDFSRISILARPASHTCELTCDFTKSNINLIVELHLWIKFEHKTFDRVKCWIYQVCGIKKKAGKEQPSLMESVFLGFSKAFEKPKKLEIPLILFCTLKFMSLSPLFRRTVFPRRGKLTQSIASTCVCMRQIISIEKAPKLNWTNGENLVLWHVYI